VYPEDVGSKPLRILFYLHTT